MPAAPGCRSFLPPERRPAQSDLQHGRDFARVLSRGDFSYFPGGTCSILRKVGHGWGERLNLQVSRCVCCLSACYTGVLDGARAGGSRWSEPGHFRGSVRECSHRDFVVRRVDAARLISRNSALTGHQVFGRRGRNHRPVCTVLPAHEVIHSRSASLPAVDRAGADFSAAPAEPGGRAV